MAGLQSRARKDQVCKLIFPADGGLFGIADMIRRCLHMWLELTIDQRTEKKRARKSG